MIYTGRTDEVAELVKLAKRMQVRQQALATAQVYMRRFYTKREIRATNPYLVLSTAFYLACKMEECPQHIRIVVGEARQLWSGKDSLLNIIDNLFNRTTETVSSDTSKLGECEFHLISEMNSQLIIHHPYRSLTDLQTQFNLNTDEISLAWSIVNDHYFTDLPLLHPPHVIAITAVFLAMVSKPNAGTTQAQSMHNAMQQLNAKTGGAVGAQPRVQSLLNWLAESAISIEAVVDCTQELISLYQLWDGFNEKACKEQMIRFVKARGLDK